MPSRGLPAVGAVLVLGAAACSGNAEPRTLYFLHAEGVAHVSNGRTAEAQLIEGTIAYGGAQLSPEKPPKLRLHFKLGGRGQLLLEQLLVVEVGVIAVEADKFVVRAQFADLTVLQDGDPPGRGVAS